MDIFALTEEQKLEKIDEFARDFTIHVGARTLEGRRFIATFRFTDNYGKERTAFVDGWNITDVLNRSIFLYEDLYGKEEGKVKEEACPD